MTTSTLKRLPRHERPHRLDILGAVLIVAATVGLMLALNWGGTRYPWGSPPIARPRWRRRALVAVLFALRLRPRPSRSSRSSVLRNPVVRTRHAAACFGMGTFIGLIDLRAGLSRGRHRALGQPSRAWR